MLNPVIPGWYADPELHFFQGRYWLYPTTSKPFDEQTYFEAFSSEDLETWRDEGIILDFKDVPWSTNRCAWAPTVAEHEGRYYFYFSAGDGAGLGVAVADRPNGPFKDALGEPLVEQYHHGAQPIDAHAFTDDDGTAYLFWGGWRHCVAARLKSNMIELAEEPRELTPPGYVEGPFMLKRQGVYYLMWSEGDWTDDTYLVAYGRSANPYGPFAREGMILNQSGAGHHSVLQTGPDTYLIAYHRRIAGDSDPHHRVSCIDRLAFRSDGTIEPVQMT